MGSNAAAFASLTKLRDHLRRIADGDVLRGMKFGIIDESMTLIRRGFLGESDPSGRPWAKKVKDDGPILVKTRAMMNGWSGRVTPRGIYLSNRKSYAEYHQNGYFQPHKLPARPMIPSPLRAMPKPWTDAWTKISTRVFDYWMAK